MPQRTIPILVLALTAVLASAAEAQQPRDPRPDVARPASARELELQSALERDPGLVASWIELAKLQEQRGALAEAERSLKTVVAKSGGTRDTLTTLAGFYNRTGQFEHTVDVLKQAAQTNPEDPKGHQLVATYYWEKAFKDAALSPSDKARYVDEGISATDRALAIDGDYVEALTYKNILLRMKANLEPGQREFLLQEADALRSRAMELQKARSGAGAATSGPPAPAPPAAGAAAGGGMAPVRVGGNIKPPAKIRDVPPVYPPAAHAAGISGMVILEIVVDGDGNVESARVLRPIPQLTEAAIDAVKQWKFAPTHLNGVPTPVVMTVTVNFTIG